MKQKHIISLEDKIRPLSYHMLSLFFEKKKSFETLDCRLNYKRKCKFGTSTHPRWADCALESHAIIDFSFLAVLIFTLFRTRGPDHYPGKLTGKYSFVEREIKRIFQYVLKNVDADTKSRDTFYHWFHRLLIY